MNNRIDCGDLSFPLTFDAIEPGDHVRSAQFPDLGGRVRAIGEMTRLRIPCVIIDTWQGRQDIIAKGDIRVLGFAGIPIL